MPSNGRAKRLILKNVPKNIEGTIFELGAGWGNLAIPLAKANRHLTVEAYELSPIPYLFLKIVSILLKVKNLKVVRKDFFKADFANASVLVCYLYPEAMEKLKVKLEKERVAKELFILSNTFAIPGWRPQKCFEINDLYSSKLYIYRLF